MKSKILLAVALLLAISTTTVWAADSSEKTNQKTGSYTNEDVWAAYEGFNNTLLDPDKYIYKTTSSYEQAVDRGHGAAGDGPQALLQPLGDVDRVQVPFWLWHMISPHAL